jgi:hypothetical protein
MMTRTSVRLAGLFAFLSYPAIVTSWSCTETTQFTPIGGGDGGGSSSGGASTSGSGSGSSSGGAGSSGGSSSGSGAGSSSGGGDEDGSSAGDGAGGSETSTGSSSGSTTMGEGGSSCVVVSTGGLPLTGPQGDYLASLPSTTPSYGGLAYLVGDMIASGCGVGAEAKPCGTSVGCVAQGEFCGSGVTGVKGDTSTANTYGAGFGAYLSQAEDGGMGTGIVPGSAGLTFTVSSAPTYELEVEIKTATTLYCQLTTVTNGTLAWNTFVEKCTSGTVGPAYDGTDPLVAVEFTARAGADPAPYDFCVTTLSF